MSVRLVTSDGVRVAPVEKSPRFSCAGGQIVDHAQPSARLTLRDAQVTLHLLHRLAITSEQEGTELSIRHGRLYATDAVSLIRAIDECERQRRSLGWANPHDADRRTS